MIYGYARVSRQEQNLDRQLDQLTAAGCERIFYEKQTGTRKDRAELNALLSIILPGDMVIVAELTRISRSTKDLIELFEDIEKRGANVKSLKESWLDTTTSQGKLMFTICAALSQFERDLTSDRTKEGLASARARGRIGGRPAVDEEKISLALRMYDSSNYANKEIRAATGISIPTIYKYINERDEGKKATPRPGNEKKVALALEMYESGKYRNDQILSATGISSSSMYRYKYEKDKKESTRPKSDGERKPIRYRTEVIALALEMYDSGKYSIKDIISASSISTTTLYRRINERRNTVG